jgi:hypothetical protein
MTLSRKRFFTIWTLCTIVFVTSIVLATPHMVAWIGIFDGDTWFTRGIIGLIALDICLFAVVGYEFIANADYEAPSDSKTP